MMPSTDTSTIVGTIVFGKLANKKLLHTKEFFICLFRLFSESEFCDSGFVGFEIVSFEVFK